MSSRYCYLASYREDGSVSLARLGPWETMEADLFAYPGVWVNTPHLNDIRVGKGCWMDYDGISETEAMELMKELQTKYDRMRMERSGRNGNRKG